MQKYMQKIYAYFVYKKYTLILYTKNIRLFCIQKIYTKNIRIYIMDSDDIYKYLGLFVIVVFVVFIIIKTMNLQLKMVEGFTAAGASTTDKNKIPDAIKNNTNMISDSLLIDKYLQAYEDTIMDLDTNLNMYILSQVLTSAETISSDPGSSASQAIITKINNIKTFSDSLNQAMKTLDKK